MNLYFIDICEVQQAISNFHLTQYTQALTWNGIVYQVYRLQGGKQLVTD